MKLEICTLCEYASEHNGRLTIVDSFDVIVASKLPWRAYFHFVAKINIENNQKKYQEIRMRIIKADDSNEILFETKGSYNHSDKAEKMNLLAGLKGIIFNSLGEYKFQVFFDNDLLIDHPLKLILKDDK
jgi:hypothetical protein